MNLTRRAEGTVAAPIQTVALPGGSGPWTMSSTGPSPCSTGQGDNDDERKSSGA
jgi:hypothetical protein